MYVCLVTYVHYVQYIQKILNSPWNQIFVQQSSAILTLNSRDEVPVLKKEHDHLISGYSKYKSPEHRSSVGIQTDQVRMSMYE